MVDNRIGALVKIKGLGGEYDKTTYQNRYLKKLGGATTYACATSTTRHSGSEWEVVGESGKKGVIMEWVSGLQ